MSPRFQAKHRWYLLRDKEQLGPFTYEQLLGLKQARKLFENDKLLPVGESQWISAQSIAGLFSSHKETILQGQDGGEATFHHPDSSSRATLQQWPIIPGYEIVDKLGQGGMGIVYKARHLGLDRLVALKMLPSQEKTGSNTLARFQREAKLLAKLEHPNIVQVYDVGEHEGQPYIALEMINGGDLADYLQKQKPTIEIIAAFVEKLARAVHLAHENGIVHRDLKPSNILLTKKGQPKITDFGIAKDLDQTSHQTATGALLGTPGYMAPEQASGNVEMIDARTDVYALGIILYEMLTGQLPFSGPGQVVIYHVLNSTPKTFRKLKLEVPSELENICFRCLAKNPKKRYESSLELAEALHTFRKSSSQVDSGSANSRRWLWPVVGGGIAIAILMAVLVLLNQRFDTVPPEKEPVQVVQQPPLQNEIPPDPAPTPPKIDSPKKENNVKPPPKPEPAIREFKRLQSEWQETTRATERIRYLLQLEEAQAYLRQGLFQQAHKVLDQCSPQHRHWEWYYLRGEKPKKLVVKSYLEGKLVQNFHDHNLPVSSVVIDAKTRRIISTEIEDGSKLYIPKAKIWDANTGKLLSTISTSRQQLFCVALSLDGNQLLTAGLNNDKLELMSWTMDDGRRLFRSVSHAAEVHSLAFSPDAKQFASAGKRATSNKDEYVADLKIWDANRGTVELSLDGHSGMVMGVAFSSDGKYLVSGGRDKTLKIWNALTGKELRTLIGHEDAVTSAAFSPDGTRIVSGSYDSTIKVWNAITGKVILTIPAHVRAINSVAYSPNGQEILSASDDETIKVWDVDSGKELLNLQGHTKSVNCALFSKAGSDLISASDDTTVKLWNISKKGHSNAVRDVLLSPKGEFTLSASEDQTIRVSRTQDGQVLHVLKGHTASVNCLDYWPGSRLIVSGSDDHTLKLWNLDTGTTQGTLEGHDGPVTNVRFSPDGKLLASSSTDHSIKIWNVSDEKWIRTLTGHSAPVRCLSFDPTGKTLLSGSDDKTAHLWDVESGKALQRFSDHAGEVLSVAFHPSGSSVLTASADNLIRLWEVETGKLIRSFQGHSARVNSIVFSPDGERLLSASNDGAIKIWEIVTGQETLTLTGHKGAIHCAKFTGDGRQIVSGGADRDVRLWGSGKSIK